jgi:hypothetical protein
LISRSCGWSVNKDEDKQCEQRGGKRDQPDNRPPVLVLRRSRDHRPGALRLLRQPGTLEPDNEFVLSVVTEIPRIHSYRVGAASEQFNRSAQFGLALLEVGEILFEPDLMRKEGIIPFPAITGHEQIADKNDDHCDHAGRHEVRHLHQLQ